jgi:hypothetical protein
MGTVIPNSPPQDSRRFQKVVAAFLAGPGLPFAEILSAQRIERIFAKHDGLFGLHGVYTTAIMVWSFLSQVLRDGKEASCQSAVARVVSYYEQAGLGSPTQDTGDYCRARAKLSEAALHELSCEAAEKWEQAADESWLWKGKQFPLEFRIGYSQYPSFLEPGARSLQVARDGASRSLDDDSGIPFDSHDGRRRGPAARQAAAPDQFHQHLPIRLGILDATVGRMDCRIVAGGLLKVDAQADRGLRSCQPPRLAGATRPETPPPRLQAQAKTKKPIAPRTSQTMHLKYVTS